MPLLLTACGTLLTQLHTPGISTTHGWKCKVGRESNINDADINNASSIEAKKSLSENTVFNLAPPGGQSDNTNVPVPQ